MPSLKYTKVKPQDFDMMLISSVRYVLGRKSYIVSWVADVVRQYRHLLADQTIDTIIRDIVSYPDLGDGQIDLVVWVDIKNKLEELRHERLGKEARSS